MIHVNTLFTSRQMSVDKGSAQYVSYHTQTHTPPLAGVRETKGVSPYSLRGHK
jgi:hypothetical protein